MSFVTVVRVVNVTTALAASPAPLYVTLVGVPGVRGPRGLPGDGSGGALEPADIGALAVSLRLAEFDTPQAQADARANLGLQTIDGGSF